MFTVAGQADLDLQHEARLEGELFDQGVGNEKIIDSRTQVIGCETQAGDLLSPLEKTCGGHDYPVIQAVSNLIHNKMPPGKVGSDSESGLDGELDQSSERELLQLVHHKRGKRWSGRCFGGGHEILTGEC
jgi:hypothetical protein